MTKLSDLYELHIHGNDYHTQTFASVNYVNSFTRDQFGKHNIINFYDPFSELPSSSSIYDRYISSTTANGGTENYIYEGSGSEGLETQPEKGSTAFLKELEQYYVFNGTSGIESDTFIDHNLLSGLQGGTTDEYYHLSQSVYTNLTSSNVSFNDITITNPNSVYNLSHNNFSDYLTTEHRQGENSITQNIHDNNITSSSITQHESNITHNNLTGLNGGETPYYYHLKQTSGNNLKDQDQALKTTSSPTFNIVSSNNNPTETFHLTRKDYVDSLIEESVLGKEDVIDFYDPSGGLPTDPADGDRYISSATGNGWTENYIYEGDNSTSTGIEEVPQDRGALNVTNLNQQYIYRTSIGEGREITILTYRDHNILTGLQGGTTDEYYHLDLIEYNNLKNQDQALKTTSSPTFNDITITNPNSVYNLSHNNFSDYLTTEHRQGENSITQNIHDNNITSSSITQHESNINHNSLTNYISSEHRQGENSITQNIHDNNITSSSITQHESNINHNSLTNYISSEHRQGENSITQNIHDNNITSSSITQHESNITHNNLTGLQGGTTNEYYHLSLNDHNKIPNGDSAYSETSSSTSSNTPNTLMKRDSHGDVGCRVFRSSFSYTNSDIAGIYTTRVIGGDHLRPSTPTQVENALPSKSNGDSAYSHSNSNGTDHTYINQDLRTSADVTFNTVSADTFNGTATSAQYSDLAERLIYDSNLPKGTVVEVTNENNKNHIRPCTCKTGNVIGVISEKPAYLMGNEVNGPNVGLIGRIHTLITGKIKKGDFIIPYKNGIAKKGRFGEYKYKIGYTLETKNSKETDLVMCFIK